MELVITILVSLFIGAVIGAIIEARYGQAVAANLHARINALETAVGPNKGLTITRVETTSGPPPPSNPTQG